MTAGNSHILTSTNFMLKLNVKEQYALKIVSD
jgi:hypothetical protein